MYRPSDTSIAVFLPPSRPSSVPIDASESSDIVSFDEAEAIDTLVGIRPGSLAAPDSAPDDASDLIHLRKLRRLMTSMDAKL